MADRARRCGKPTVDGSPCRNGPGCTVKHTTAGESGTKALAATHAAAVSSPPLAGEPDGKYGPRTAVVEKIIDRAGRLTAQEERALAAAWYADAAWSAAYDAVRATAWSAAKATAWSAAGDAWHAAGDAEAAARAVGTVAVRSVAWSAALAAAVTHLEGQHGLTRQHLETLAGPWRSVIHDVDPLAALESNDG